MSPRPPGVLAVSADQQEALRRPLLLVQPRRARQAGLQRHGGGAAGQLPPGGQPGHCVSAAHPAAPVRRGGGDIATRGRHGDDMTWGRHGDYMGATWGRHGDNMGTTWGRHGGDMGATWGRGGRAGDCVSALHPAAPVWRGCRRAWGCNGGIWGHGGPLGTHRTLWGPIDGSGGPGVPPCPIGTHWGSWGSGFPPLPHRDP